MSGRPRVVITHWVDDEVVALLEERCEVIANPSRETLPRELVLERARRAQALMAFMPDRLDEPFLAACPELKVVAGALKGYDNFDVVALRRRGVWFTIVPDLLTAPTAELAVGLVLALARRMLPGDEHARSGRFQGWRPILYGDGLAARTAGLIGMGALGRAVARRLAAFDTRLLYTDERGVPPSEASGAVRVELPELLARSDYVLALAPLTPRTFHLLDDAALALMRRGSYLVNIGRGSVVDESSVAAALASGRLAGYAADVFEMEDWARSDRPLAIPAALRLDRDRTVLTPHLGSAVADVRKEIALWAAKSILEGLSGEQPRGAIVGPGLAGPPAR
jgi:phosphonate dehydrogenase